MTGVPTDRLGRRSFAWPHAILVTAAVLACGPAAAAAATDAPPDHELVWTIDQVSAPAGEVWLKKQQQIVEARLLPTQLFVVDAAVRSATGDPLIAAGAQLVRLQSARLVACTVGKGAAGTHAARTRVCFVDADADGRFDSAFDAGSGGYYWFALVGDRPNRTIDLAPASYREIPATAFGNAPRMTFHYQRYMTGAPTLPSLADGRDNYRFHFKVGTAKRQEWMVRDCTSPAQPSYCAKGPTPARFSFAGLTLDIFERRGQDIKVKVATPFERRKIKLIHLGGQYTTGELLLVD